MGTSYNLKWRGQSILHYAVISNSKGALETTKLLLERGAVLDTAVNRTGLVLQLGDTPLIAACRLGRIEVIQFLLEAGSDASLVNLNGEIALIVACRQSRWDVVDALLSRRTKEELNIAAKDSLGGSALEYASRNGAADEILAKLNNKAR